MTLIDVKKALLDLLKSEFPDYKYYSTDVIEAYDRPWRYRLSIITRCTTLWPFI